MAGYKRKAESGTGITPKELFTKLAKEPENIHLLLLYGPEEYMSVQAIEMLKRRWIGEGAEEMDMSVLDLRFGEKYDFNKLEDAACAIPWMSERRLVVVKGANIAKCELKDRELNLIKDIPSTTVLVFFDEFDEKIKKTTAAFKTINSVGVIADMSRRDTNELRDWIVKRASKMNLSISSYTAESVAERCKFSMRVIAGELDKIALYCSYKGLTEITDDIVELTCPPDMNAVVFDIMDSCVKGNGKKAMVTFEKIIADGAEVSEIRGVLRNNVRNMICAKELKNTQALTDALGIKEYPAKKAISQSNSYTMKELISLYRDCVDGEYEFKTGRMDERTAMEMFIFKAATGASD